MRHMPQFIAAFVFLHLWPAVAPAAGTLTPVGSPDQALEVAAHHVNVIIMNGFVKTEVIQRFENPNPHPIEGLYAFPLPKNASLSEMTITCGETTIQGEVVAKDRAEQLYEEEKSKGNQAGRAEQDGHQRFEFRVARIDPRGKVTVRFVYYQVLTIDTGIGRYLYPLEEGGTDEVQKSFWRQNDRVNNGFSLHLTLKSAWPIAELRVPGYENAAVVNEIDATTRTLEIVQSNAALNRDFVFYYRLADDLPGRVEVIPYRADDAALGTFMMVVTPGIDLGPLRRGADYVFVLDVSGSMEGKLATLADGVTRALGQMRAHDRFRIVTFENRARELTGGWVAAKPAAVKRWVKEVAQLATGGGTNLFDGLKLGLAKLDDDRATSVILVTDAETNTGVVDPGAFSRMMQKYDVRVFGFLMGNSANWPLMRLIADASGGFYSGVSNADDIIGQILLAKSKVTHEALHAATIDIDGVDVFEMTDIPRKIYRGQQLVFLGRYRGEGRAKVRLEASLTGQDRVYETELDFPKIDTDNPELERLWAMDRIEKLELLADSGTMPAAESKRAVKDLGLAYQLVTDETSMLALADEAFERHQVDRNNRERVARESRAQAQRASQPVKQYRADNQRPMFKNRAPRLPQGGGGGSIGLFGFLLFGLIPALAAGVSGIRRRHRGP